MRLKVRGEARGRLPVEGQDVTERGKGKITLPEGAIVVQLPKCPYCRQIINACRCGEPTKRPAA